jgi:hypothetical protein
VGASRDVVQSDFVEWARGKKVRRGVENLILPVGLVRCHQHLRPEFTAKLTGQY